MDEAKTLTHMSISAIFASMILAAAVGIIGLGYTMWSYFSRQEAANRRMADYANYTSFDSTTVRGQEVMELLESDLEVFVLFYDGSANGSYTDIDHMNVGAPTAIAYPDLAGVKDFRFDTAADGMGIPISTDTLSQALSKTVSLGSTPETLISVESLNGKTYDELLKIFTTSASGSGPKLGKPNADPSVETGSYAAFKSLLIYANDGTTDVAGVVLVREHPGIESY